MRALEYTLQLLRDVIFDVMNACSHIDPNDLELSLYSFIYQTEIGELQDKKQVRAVQNMVCYTCINTQSAHSHTNTRTHRIH